MSRPKEQYLADAIIQNYEVPTIINANEKCSTITTGLLEALDLKKCHIRFQRKSITLSGENIKSLGKIKNLAIILKHISIKPTLHIIEDNYPCIVFRQDWFKQYQVQYNVAKTKLRFCYQNQKVYVPIIKLVDELEDHNEVLPSSDDEKEIFINMNLNCNQTKVKEGFLVDLSEDNMISQQEDKPLLIPLDLFELDVEKFQQTFD